MSKISRKIKKGLKSAILGLISVFMFFISLSAYADTVDYDLLTSNYNTTIYLATSNVVDTQSNLSFENINGFNMINTKYPSANSSTSALNREVITYTTNTIKTINSNMALYMKYNNATTRINFNLNNVTQFSFLSTSTPTIINNDLNVYKFTDEIQFDAIEIFNNYIGSKTETPFYFTILNANERAYNLGYNDAIQKYNELDIEYQQLLSNYTSLEQMYNSLAEGQYTFESLFWSIGSVPMAVLLQTFNVNVLGMNIRAIITGFLTALVVIWLIKRLFK